MANHAGMAWHTMFYQTPLKYAMPRFSMAWYGMACHTMLYQTP